MCIRDRLLLVVVYQTYLKAFGTDGYIQGRELHAGRRTACDIAQTGNLEPFHIRNVSEREIADRKLVFDFKDGRAYEEVAQRTAANMTERHRGFPL